MTATSNLCRCKAARSAPSATTTPSSGPMGACSCPKVACARISSRLVCACRISRQHRKRVPRSAPCSIQATMKVTLPASSKRKRAILAFWVGYAPAELKPLYLRLRELILTSGKIAVDETVGPVLDPGRGRTKGYFWAIARDDRPWGGTDRPSPTPTLRVAAPSTRSSCSTTIAASCSATICGLQDDCERCVRRGDHARLLLGPPAAPILRHRPRRPGADRQRSSLSALLSSTRSRRRSGARAPASAVRCYASQQEIPVRRAMRRAQKIKMRLGGSDDPLEPFPQKPRVMHRRTYRRLREQARAADAERDYNIMMPRIVGGMDARTWTISRLRATSPKTPARAPRSRLYWCRVGPIGPVRPRWS